MPTLDAGAETPWPSGGVEPSSSNRLRSAAPRIVETWIERVTNRRGATDGEDDWWIAAYRAFGASTLQRIALRLRGGRMGTRNASTAVVGRMVAAGRRSGAQTWQIVDDLMLLVPATLGELPGDGRVGPRAEMVGDQIGSAVIAVARGMEAMAARMERERSETFAARVEMLVHELHNRFGAADTASRLLTRRSVPPDPDWLERIASLIQSSIDDGLRTVEDMRPLVTRERAGEGAESWAVPLPALVRDVLGAYESMAADRGVDLRASGTLPEALVDGSWFRMILSNLVDNALAFHDRAKSRRTVVITATRPGPRRVAVSVRDNGVGIPEGRLKEIFLPGIRRHDARAARREGLGLAVVREALGRMGGMVEVASERGMTTTFRVTVTCLTAEQGSREAGGEPH